MDVQEHEIWSHPLNRLDRTLSVAALGHELDLRVSTQGTYRPNFDAWRVERRADGSWGQPAPLSSVINNDTTLFAPSLARGGVLYFNRGDVIYRAEPKGGDYAAPQPLPFHGSDPGISSDERFIVFDDTPRAAAYVGSVRELSFERWCVDATEPISRTRELEVQ